MTIGGVTLPVKDYFCARGDSGDYFPREKTTLWLYVNLTDACQGRCPFCVNPSLGTVRENPFDLARYRQTIAALRPYVHGVSLTGGEPLLDIPLFLQVLRVTAEVFGEDVEIDSVTNGIHLAEFLSHGEADLLTTLHISRHSPEDAVNRSLMGWEAPGKEELATLVRGYKDPGLFVFNCVLQKGGVETVEDVKAYLEMAAEVGIRNSSFIGMFQANDYCRDHYISPGSLDIGEKTGFRVWNRFHDYDICACTAGDYRTNHGLTRYYFRCPGTGTAHYCRQIVYTADNRLLAGFGGQEIEL